MNPSGVLALLPAWPAWLGETPATVEELKSLLKPCPDEDLKMWPIDSRVGNVRNEGPEFVAPISGIPVC